MQTIYQYPDFDELDFEPDFFSLTGLFLLDELPEERGLFESRFPVDD